jgi:hypothetical protein
MKLAGFIIMMITLISVLTFLGIDTGLSGTLSVIGITMDSSGNVSNADFESSSLWNWVTGVGVGLLVLLGITGSIIVGLFGKGYDVSLVLAPFIVSVGGAFVVCFWSILRYVIALNVWWMTAITTIILGGLFVGYVFSCVDYFAGR